MGDLEAAFGGQRSITLCRELTKLYEEVCKTTIEQAIAYYSQNDPRGEYVLVMAGGEPAAAPAAALTLEQAVEKAKELMQEGMAPSMAAKQAAKGTVFAKNLIYKALVEE